MHTSTRSPSRTQAAAAKPRRASLRPRTSVRTKVLAAGLIVLILSALGTGIGGDIYARALEAAVVSDLKAASADLELGKTDLTHATGDQAAASIASAKHHFLLARNEFRRADRRLQNDPILSHAQVGPGAGYLGPRIQAVHNIGEMGIAVADAGSDAIPMQESLLGLGAEQQGLSAGQRLVGFLKSSTPLLQQLESDLQRASEAAGKVDTNYLPSAQRATFLAAKGTIANGLAGIVGLRTSLPGLLDILGANGTRTYLIEQMNPAELRAGGGFIGSYGILRVEGGKFGLIQSAGIADADYPRPDVTSHCIDARYNPTPCRGHTYVRPPSVMLDFLGNKSWVLGDSNFWADFPTSARAAETLTQRELQTHVDGVIAIDPQFLAALLQVTGPIKVPNFDFTADPKTFTKDLFEYENSRTAGPATVRKALFTYLAPVLIDRITTLPSGRWTDLIKALNSAAASHDLQVFFNNDAAQKEVSGYGWAGVVPAGPHKDFMMEVESNFGGTKANQFVSRSYDVQLTAASGVLHHKVTVSLSNSMPEGKYEGANYYRTYGRFYYADAGSNGRASNLVKDQHAPDETPPAGLHMIDGWQQVNVKPDGTAGSTSFSFEYDTPFDGTPYDIYWQKQAGTNADHVTVTFTVQGSSRKVEGDLSQDRLIHLSGSTVTLGSGLNGSAKLPGITL